MKCCRSVLILVGMTVMVAASTIAFFRPATGQLYWLMAPASSGFNDNTILRLSSDGQILEIPHEIAQFWTAVWSPDGQYVAYVSGIFYDLYAVRYDGTQLTRLFGCFGPVQSPTWSPNSRQIAFVADCRQQTLSLFVMDFDRNQIRAASHESTLAIHATDDTTAPLSVDLTAAVYNEPDIRRLTDDDGIETNPVWSPDGEWIAFQAQRNGRTNVFRIRPDGSDMQQLTHERNAWRPVWSPDGEWIAYQTIHDTTNLAIKRVHVESGEVQMVTTLQSQNPPTNYWSPWSPDSGWIVFTSTRDNDQEIYRVRADGTDLQRLTYHDGYDGQPTWSPDGAWIGFLSARDGAFEIFRMRPDGSDVQRLTDNAAFEQLPMWSPLIDKPLSWSKIFCFGLSLAVGPLAVQITLPQLKLCPVPNRSIRRLANPPSART